MKQLAGHQTKLPTAPERSWPGFEEVLLEGIGMEPEEYRRRGE